MTYTGMGGGRYYDNDNRTPMYLPKMWAYLAPAGSPPAGMSPLPSGVGRAAKAALSPAATEGQLVAHPGPAREKERTMKREPMVVADDGASLRYSDARRAWEAGEFSGWLAEHGLPLTIGRLTIRRRGGIEDALSDDTWD